VAEGARPERGQPGELSWSDVRPWSTYPDPGPDSPAD